MDTKKRGLTGRPDRTFDIETGEVQDGALVWIPKRNVSQFGRGWFQMAQDTLKRLNAERKALGLEGLVVFNALMARLDFENYIQVSQADIAAEVDMKPSNVSKAVSKLLELGFIRRGPKVGRSYTYQLHPELAWKGKSKNHFQAREAAARRAGPSSRAAGTLRTSRTRWIWTFDELGRLHRGLTLGQPRRACFDRAHGVDADDALPAVLGLLGVPVVLLGLRDSVPHCLRHLFRRPAHYGRIWPSCPPRTRGGRCRPTRSAAPVSPAGLGNPAGFSRPCA